MAATGALKSTNLGTRLTRIKRSEVDAFLSLPAQSTPQIKQYTISECYSIGETQQRFGISDKGLRDIIERNGIPKFQKGKFVFVPKELLDRIFL